MGRRWFNGMVAPEVLSLREFGELSPAGPSVVTIGNFDGVHRGHQHVLDVCRQAATKHASAQVAVLTFEPHPLAVLAPQRAPARLSTAAERVQLLRAAGADQVVTLASVPALFELEAENFLARVVRALRPVEFIEGAEFRFGRNRGGSLETLRSHSREYGFCVSPLEAVMAGFAPAAQPVSSTGIRAALAEGRVADAAELLGRPHRIVGVVVAGDARGRTLGFPTANLSGIRQMTPGLGVYAALAQTAAGALYPAAVNIGPQPTFGQSATRVEAHLLGFAGELCGAALGLHFVAKLRDPRKFNGPQELVTQLQRDVQETRAATVRFAAPIQIPL